MTSDRGSNLWRASSRETFSAGTLDRDLSVDLLVIGGGFTGNSAALEASRSGASVCLLEAETVGHGGSGRNVGLANAGLWLPPEDIIAQVGEEAGNRLVRDLGEAPARVYSIIEREGIDCEATRKGTLHLAHSTEGFKDIEERFRQGNRYGAPLQLLDAAEAARRTGTDIYHGALFDPRAGTIQPLAYARGLARAAKAAGASIFERSPVTALEREGGQWVAGCNGYSVRAKRLLVGTNAYHLGIETPFKPAFIPVGYCQFATVPMPDRARTKILAGGEGCWDTALVMSSFRIDRAGRMIVGGMGDSEGPSGGIHAGWARRKLKSLFPEIGDLPFEHAWRGRIAMTSDHVPKIVAFGPDAYASFGYSGRGIGPGTVFGAQAAIALLENNPDALPVKVVQSHSERFASVRAAYYEFGATLTHALPIRAAGK